jgi:hypothetical protein
MSTPAGRGADGGRRAVITRAVLAVLCVLCGTATWFVPWPVRVALAVVAVAGCAASIVLFLRARGWGASR